MLQGLEYLEWFIGTYWYWTLFLDVEDQTTPGRAYLWLHARPTGKLKISDLREVEHMECVEILQKYEWAMGKLFPLVGVDVEWSMNAARIGQLHITPRFTEPVHLAPADMRNQLWRKLREWRSPSVLS